ncbi:TIGR02281 family clan AA aspartic protease [Novosphingobium profundi]|uniref:retropepsin-like aspartic protease family protein n=1 Tax=Novosphingobium profundi TaxID=1774954 RepID=UPI001BDACDE6|nr:TIGR02281 family clan AA aspartic protease [Novosphingobium profundi]MBT0667671.1 TIGR02281 family clan AA aspartic protease [Novosphingobium profundi]
MRLGPVILLLATAAVVGWLAPDLTSGSGKNKVMPARGRAEAAARDDQAARKQAWLAGATLVERAGDGQFYLDADVEGSSTHFLVDTGASIVALTAADARAAGLDWSEDDVRVIGKGASGTVRGVPVRLSELDLDGFVARDVDAAIIPEGLEVSLLGQSFLTRLSSVKVDGNRMTIVP